MPPPRSTPVVERLIAALPALSLDNLRSISRRCAETRQVVLAKLILDAVSGRHPHRSHPGASYFSRDMLTKALQCARRDNIHLRFMALCFSFPEGHKGYHSARGTAKPFTLLPHVRLVAERVLAADAQPTVAPSLVVEDSAGKPIIAAPTLLSEITLDHVERALTDCDARDTEALAWLHDVRDAIAEHVGLPNSLTLASNGRLRPVETVHLINMPRRVRALLLRDLGWWDFDLRSCHLSIVRDLGRHFDLPVERIERYLGDKDAHHVEWSRRIGHDVSEDFKEIILSFLNGAKRSPSAATTLGRALGRDKATRWLKLSSVGGLLDELQAVVRQIVKHFRQDGTCMNAVAELLPDAGLREAASHLLTGFEQWIMRELLARLPAGSLRCPIYDGWVANGPLSQAQLSGLEHHVARKSLDALGIKLRVSISAKPFAPAATVAVAPTPEELEFLGVGSSEPAPSPAEAHDPEVEAWLRERRHRDLSRFHLERKEEAETPDA